MLVSIDESAGKLEQCCQCVDEEFGLICLHSLYNGTGSDSGEKYLGSACHLSWCRTIDRPMLTMGI